MYIVNTDEELFQEIDTMLNRLRHLFLYFQNAETKMSSEELDCWYADCAEYQEELSRVIGKCSKRIKKEVKKVLINDRVFVEEVDESEIFGSKKYNIFVDGEFVCILYENDGKFATGDSKNEFSKLVVFPTLEEAALYHL